MKGPIFAAGALLLAVSARAAQDLTGGKTYVYRCDCLCDDRDCADMRVAPFELRLSGANASIESIGKSGPVDSGRYDPTYQPPRFKNYARYVGWDSLWDGEFMSTVLVDKALLSGGERLRGGKSGGMIKIEDTGEAFYITKYLCVEQTP